jgi:hypothetical protein
MPGAFTGTASSTTSQIEKMLRLKSPTLASASSNSQDGDDKRELEWNEQRACGFRGDASFDLVRGHRVRKEIRADHLLACPAAAPALNKQQ